MFYESGVEYFEEPTNKIKLKMRPKASPHHHQHYRVLTPK